MPQTVNGCLILASRQLQSIESGEKVARLLLANILGQNESWLWAHGDEVVADDIRQRFESLVRRAAEHEPLAYLLGWVDFYGQRFEVNPSVLIPRPETERLVEAVLEFAGQRHRLIDDKGLVDSSRLFEHGHATRPRHRELVSGSENMPPMLLKQVQDDETVNVNPSPKSSIPSLALPTPPLTIVDVGTGSGCVALTLARLLPDASIYALDISPEALEVAQRNACRLEVSNVTFRQGNLLQPLQNALQPHSVDVIVANLPYISDVEFENLPLNVKNFEPELALRSGSEDPDRLNKMLIEQAKHWLKPDGFLAYETTNGKIVENQKI